MPLLGPADAPPAIAENPGADSPFLFLCDHAGRAVPGRLGALGLPPAAFDNHIAWDIGALDLARRLASATGSCLVHQVYSRLVIDCNRAPDHPQSIVAVSDGWPVPGNAGLSANDREARRVEIFVPYHARIAAELDQPARSGCDTLIVCVHSFTPVMDGARRPWDVGVLHLGDSPASNRMLELLRAESGLVVGDNEPYAMDGTDYTAPFHAGRRGLDMLELEIRQDLLGDADGVVRMGDLIAPLLQAVRR